MSYGKGYQTPQVLVWDGSSVIWGPADAPSMAGQAILWDGANLSWGSPTAITLKDNAVAKRAVDRLRLQKPLTPVATSLGPVANIPVGAVIFDHFFIAGDLSGDVYVFDTTTRNITTFTSGFGYSMKFIAGAGGGGYAPNAPAMLAMFTETNIVGYTVGRNGDFSVEFNSSYGGSGGRVSGVYHLGYWYFSTSGPSAISSIDILGSVIGDATSGELSGVTAEGMVIDDLGYLWSVSWESGVGRLRQWVPENGSLTLIATYSTTGNPYHVTYDGKHIWTMEDVDLGDAMVAAAYSPLDGTTVNTHTFDGALSPERSGILWDGELIVVANNSTIYTFDPGVEDSSLALSLYQVATSLGTLHATVVDENRSIYVVYDDDVDTYMAVMEGPEPNLHVNDLRVENNVLVEQYLSVQGATDLQGAQSVLVSEIGTPGAATLDEGSYRIVFTVTGVVLTLPADIPVGREIKIKDKSGLLTEITTSTISADTGEDIDGAATFNLTVPYEEVCLTKDTLTSWSIG